MTPTRSEESPTYNVTDDGGRGGRSKHQVAIKFQVLSFKLTTNLLIRRSGMLAVRAILAACTAAALAAQPITSTLAGGGASGTARGVLGGASGVGTAALFYAPTSVALSVNGTVFLGEPAGIYTISPSGSVSLIAGAAAYGAADGLGAAATFNQIQGLALTANSLVVGDSGNNKLRAVSLAPVAAVTTLAGGGASGTSLGAADGVGTNAYMQYPTGVAVAPSGVVYFADTSNTLVRSLGLDGTVLTFAGRALGGASDGVT